jgi:hypothetical protein
MRKDGTAIAIRIRTGTTVQAISRMVLWVVRDGIGFRFSLKRITMATISTSTNSEIAVMSQSSQ